MAAVLLMLSPRSGKGSTREITRTCRICTNRTSLCSTRTEADLTGWRRSTTILTTWTMILNPSDADAIIRFNLKYMFASYNYLKYMSHLMNPTNVKQTNLKLTTNTTVHEKTSKV